MVWGESPDVVFTRIGCNCTDLDDDGLTACEDNCPDDWNLSQSDFDIDSEGDVIRDGRAAVGFLFRGFFRARIDDVLGLFSVT